MNIPDMYLLSTLVDALVISWFGNCYHKSNDVCFICINITFDKTYIRYLLAFVHRGDSKKMYSGDT